MPKTASIKVNLANNTLAGNSAAVLAALSAAGLLPASDLDTDATMAADSDARVPTQKATRAYVASVLAGVAKNKGPLDCSANPNYPVGLNGDFYRCSVAGKVGGASGVVVEVADLIMCVADNAGGTQASVGTSWIVGQANIAGITAAGLAMLQAADATAQAALLAAVTETLTNKRITPRIGSTTSSATPTINTDNVDRYDLTAQAADITSFTSNLSGTPTNGQALWISVTGTAARAITWGAAFENGAATLPTTTVTTDRLDVLFVWNAVTSKWRCTLTTVAAGLSDAPSNGHPYARKDGSWVRLEDSAIYLPTFATNVTSIAGWTVTGDTPVLVGTDVKFANPGSVTDISATDDFDTGATLDFSLLTGLLTIGSNAFYGQSNLTGALTIPDAVTSLGTYAFAGCSGLTSVTIPANVSTIGNSAFTGCTGLTSLTIPDAVTSLGTYAFAGCSGLTSITLGTGIATINNSVFGYCTGLTSVTIPANVSTIGNSAFAGCTGLTSLTIPDAVTDIGSYAFYNCSGLTSVSFGTGLGSLGEYAFFGCTGLTSVTIPDNVTFLSNRVFKGCSGLTNITIGTGVSSIGYEVWMNCAGLTSVTIPNNVASLGSAAFYNCSNLATVNAYVELSVLDVTLSLYGTIVTNIHARASDGTWTAGAGQTIGGKNGITVTKDL